MIEIVLTDNSTTATLPRLAPPLSETTVEGSRDVITLDMNMTTYFSDNKRLWGHTWPILTIDEYNVVKGFYDRQFTDFSYPLIDIADLAIADVPVRMTINPKNIIDNCLTVQNVTVSFRETRQL